MSNQNKFSGTVDQTHSRDLSRVSFGFQRHASLQSVSQSEDLPFSQVARFLLLHAPLMFIFRAAPITATIHSLIVLFIGLYYLIHDKQPIRVTWVIAYIAGAEILWRGMEASPVSEYGKYATLLLCILIILKYRLLGRATLWPLLFIALLIPGIFIAPGFDRQLISFQLAGLVTMAVASMAFSALEFKKSDLQRLFLAVIAPTIAMGFLVAFLAGTTGATFSAGDANEVVTGGIGANQVTSALSLGATAAFFYFFLAGRAQRTRNLMIVLVIGFITLSVLTFSRAGLWNTAGALAMGALFLMRDRRLILKLIGIVLVIGLLGSFVIFPMLNKMTGGTMLVRYSDFDSTGRDVLVRIDYQVFLDNPILGVGVGQSRKYHIPYFGYAKSTHTEYGRLLAEHGSLGLAVIALLIGITLFRVFSHRSPISKAISTGFTVWALLYMLAAATRMVAPSFAFGLAAARFLPEDKDSHD